jgi:3-oxoacyl-[acyl-carrier protein] reductase
MDLGLAGRRVRLALPDRSLTDACAHRFEAEGAVVDGDWSTTPADVVVTGLAPNRSSAIVDITSPSQLREAWQSAIDAIAVSRAAVAAMISNEWGRLVWVGASTAKSLDSGADQLGGAISLGMMGLHKVIGSAFGRSGVTANVVLRGTSVDDSEVASAVAFLCSEPAAFLTGVTITLDSGTGSAMF